MAIAFVVGIGALTGGLASLVTSSASRRAPVEQARNQQYAAEGAIEDAAGRVRLLADPAVEPCVSARQGYYSSALNRARIRVDCTNALSVTRSRTGTVVEQRDVVFEACLDVGVRCGTAAATVLARARINYEMAAGGGVARTTVQTWSTRP